MGGRTYLRFCLRESAPMSLDKFFNFSLLGGSKRRVKASRLFSVLFLIAAIAGCGGGGSGGGSSTPPSSTSKQTATATTVSLSSQVQNPVHLLPQDYNGVIVELQSVPNGGASSLNGSLVLGIETEGNNTPSSLKPLTLDGDGDFTTSYNGVPPLTGSFIDTGSNGLFFPQVNNMPPLCQGQNIWYCPQPSFSNSATQEGANGNQNIVPFTIGNFDTLFSSGNHVLPIGGLDKNEFDWGLPFYFGQNVAIEIEGESSPHLGTGPLFSIGPFSQSQPGPNVMPITVDGTQCIQGAYNNEPCVSVKVCTPGSTTSCVTINGILLDTGSYGLRIFNQALNGVALNKVTASDGGQLAECMQFADGSAEWGPVETADVVLGNESAVNVPIQVIDSTFPGSSNCSGTLDTSPSAVGYNGILGVGPFQQDCGLICTQNNFSSLTQWPYWSIK